MSTLGVSILTFHPLAVVAPFAFLLVICMGFMVFSWKSLLFMWVFLFFYVFDVICMGFLMVFADRPLLVAICVGFFVLLCF